MPAPSLTTFAIGASGLAGSFSFAAYNQVAPPATPVPLTPPTIYDLGGGQYGFATPPGAVAWVVISPSGQSPPAFWGCTDPSLETFGIFQQGTPNTPATGQAAGFTFTAYNQVNPPAAPVGLTPPTIYELGGGQYGFRPTFGVPNTGVAFTLTSPAGTWPPGFSDFVGSIGAIGTWVPPVPNPDPGADFYARAARQLLPPGKLWNLEPGSELSQVLQALADEPARIGAAGVALTAEFLPSTAVQMLPDWLRVLGLPDATIPVLPATQAGQQVAAAQKYAAQGGQTPAYFLQLAAACGYPNATITQFYNLVFRAGMAIGVPIDGVAWAFAWQMTMNAPAANALTLAQVQAVITKYSPAHTVVSFN